MSSFKRAVPGESPPRRRVLLLLEWFEYEIHRGVAAYAQEAHWILEDVGGHMAHIPPAWNGDGIVALLCTHEKSPHAQFVARARRPTVDLTCELTGRRLARVLPDNDAIGRLGAEHLLSRGFKELAFYHAYDARVESERMAGFRRAVRRAGQSFHHLDLASAPRRYQRGEHRLNYLTDMLQQLPRPLGVMAQYDTRASEVVLACERASLAVPEQVAVVGADNDPITSELGLVPLTSVDTNRFQLGYGVGLISTADWVSFDRHGMIFTTPNKDCAIIPRRIGKYYYALHRPSSPTFGGHYLWTARSEDLLHWGDHRCIATTRSGTWDSARLGAGGGPFWTEQGWLEIYHGANDEDRYCLGLILLDPWHPTRILARSIRPILEPEAEYERKGFFGGVVFTNGHVVDGSRITVYYGAADTCVCGAQYCLESLLQSLKEMPR